jgi:hypothetical protein
MSTRRFTIALPGSRKIGLYASLIVLPGGGMDLVLMGWREAGTRRNRVRAPALVWYGQFAGWGDAIPGLWRMLRRRPRAVSAATSRERADPVLRYLSVRGASLTSCAAASSR